MRYLSVCSGVGSDHVAWGPLGWECVAFAEIDPQASAVLAHRFPDIPNGGDFTKIKGDEFGPLDLIAGGTPCQSFSVAGLRGGLADDRGNLSLEFCRLLDRAEPTMFVWENVPGVISIDGGDALDSILLAFEELGYVVDLDIEDAQYFGLAQRRKRVVICGERVESLVARKTTSSRLTIAQCLVEILHAILVEASASSGSGRVCSDYAHISRDGAKRRMKLFGITGGEGCELPTLLSDLAEITGKPSQGPVGLDSSSGRSARERTAGGQFSDSRTASQSSPTGLSWSGSWEDACEVMRSFITSTPTSGTTERTIFICSKAALSIGRLILRSNPSSPPFWSAASSALIAIQDGINYARQASSDLFADPEWVQPWADFVREAVPVGDALGDLGIGSFGEVHTLAESLQGCAPPSREEGKAADSLTASGVGTRGADDGQAQAGHLVAGTLRTHTRPGSNNPNDELIAGTVTARMGRARGAASGDSDNLVVSAPVTSKWAKGTGGPAGDEAQNLIVEPVAPSLTGNPYGDHESREGLLVAHTLTGEGHDASEDGTGRGTPIVAFGVKDSIPYDIEDISPTLRSMSHKDGKANAGGQVGIVAFDARQQDVVVHGDKTGALDTDGYSVALALSLRGREGGNMPELRSAGGGANKQYVLEVAGTLHGGSGDRGWSNGTDMAAAGFLQPVGEFIVRRVTPREAERLMGLPDDWTLVPWNGRMMADGPRYRMIGNGWAVDMFRWVGERIEIEMGQGA